MRKGWTCILRSDQPAEAGLAESVLQASGIPVTLRNAAISGLGGMIPMVDTRVEVWVPEELERDALRIIGRAMSDGELSLADPRGGELSPVAGSGALSEPGGRVAVAPDPGPAAATDSEDPTCAACGVPWEPGFEVCWNCQAQEPTSAGRGSSEPAGDVDET